MYVKKVKGGGGRKEGRGGHTVSFFNLSDCRVQIREIVEVKNITSKIIYNYIPQVEVETAKAESSVLIYNLRAISLLENYGKDSYCEVEVLRIRSNCNKE